MQELEKLKYKTKNEFNLIMRLLLSILLILFLNEAVHSQGLFGEITFNNATSAKDIMAGGNVGAAGHKMHKTAVMTY